MYVWVKFVSTMSDSLFVGIFFYLQLTAGTGV